MDLNECLLEEYYIIHFQDKNWTFIYQSMGGRYTGDYIHTEKKQFNSVRGNSTSWRTDIPSTVRPATAFESNWLKKCIRSDKFLERPSILNIYGLRK